MNFNEVMWIDLKQLVAHPDNANVMSSGVMEKLRRQIAHSGRYEPLVVRPHPRDAGKYQLINGHHRKEILESLGHASAACVVWNLDDAETLMLLATVNRLGGEDAPGKRVALLEKLAAASAATAERLAELVPEGEAELRAVLDRTEIPGVPADAPRLSEMPEALTVFLKAEEKARIVKGLKETARDLRAALLTWADRWESRNMHE